MDAKHARSPIGAESATKPRRWLMLVHQLPASPSNLRVRTWRRLQELGAVALKQSVYVLPDSADAREDFEWLKVEIDGSGGGAAVFLADAIDAGQDAVLIEEFRRARQAAYAELAAELQRVQRGGAGRARRRSDGVRDHLSRYRQRLAAIERIDFFGSAGRDRVQALLSAIEGADGGGASTPPPAPPSDEFTNRTWVTRPLPGVDRMSSAWLIRRFIDPAARFDFCADPEAAPAGVVSFDMFGGTFTHEGSRCTFETLVARFGIDDAAVSRLAEIVHDVDLKDAMYGAAEAPTVAATIEGLQLACADDHALLEQGIGLFEALYRSFAKSGTRPRPRPVVRRPTAATASAAKRKPRSK